MKDYEVKVHTAFKGRSEHGRSTVEIECPFCHAITEAYCWSLAGSGKKCDSCSAKHVGMGLTYRNKTAPKE